MKRAPHGVALIAYALPGFSCQEHQIIQISSLEVQANAHP
jgi:hypothetical protein